MLYFGYTACPDICPTSMATLKAALALLTPAEVAQVQGLFVSVDPERDTLEHHAQRYVGYFHPSLIGLSGHTARIAGDYAPLRCVLPQGGSAGVSNGVYD